MNLIIPRIFCLETRLLATPFQTFLFEVWRWLPHMPRHCIDTLRGIVKCRANSTTAAKIAVRQVKPFEVGRERSMLREDNIFSNPVSGTETNRGHEVIDFPTCIAILPVTIGSEILLAS
ncbi:hypothetical protein AVEN_183660-1 [Araneus ventricosus]|uniref:Uncharacterized protein n=1 Tax=Araneus ventricosus TaxID=182803 RepID=A0A4Y2WZ27_ARAVE|nr:hypothetical protein AVEN_183660-1 [Araneus ventricosus]